MKTIPILFNTEMVRALQEGRKTQTRRIIKPQPDFNSAWKNLSSSEQVLGDLGADVPEAEIIPHINLSGYYLGLSKKSDAQFTGTGFVIPNVPIPYHKGDILWVRETWRKYYPVDESGYTDFNKIIIEFKADNPEEMRVCDGDGFQELNKDGTEKLIPWKSPLFMPKAACRLFLKVVSVRVERLQDISEADAPAEGIKICSNMNNNSGSVGYVWPNSPYDKLKLCHSMASTAFSEGWEMINGTESWNQNPWVWVVEFERTEKPAGFLK